HLVSVRRPFDPVAAQGRPRTGKRMSASPLPLVVRPVLCSAAQKPRPTELKDPLNRFLYHPLAARLARLLQPTGISPNAVSVAGMLCAWTAAWAYAALDYP